MEIRDSAHLAEMLIKTVPLPDASFRLATVLDPSALYISFDGDYNDDGTRYQAQAQVSALSTYLPVAGDHVLVMQKNQSSWIVIGSVPFGMAASNWQVVGTLGSSSTFQNSWTHYDDGEIYGPARYRQDADGWVHLDGLIKSGATGTAFTLPSVLAPAGLTICAQFSNTGIAFVWVDTSGNVQVTSYGTGGSNANVSLAGISFLPSLVTPGMTDWVTVGSESGPAFQNSWVGYSLTDGRAVDPGYCVDSAGWVHLRGMTNGGGTNTAIFTIPAALVPDKRMIFNVPAGAGVARLDVFPTGDVVLSNYAYSGSNAFVSLDTVGWIPAAAQSLASSGAPGDWLGETGSNMNNSWLSFDATETTYPFMRYVKNSLGVCRLGGLVKSGTLAANMKTIPLPAKLRPDYQTLIMASVNGGVARVEVTAAGNVLVGVYGSAATNAFVSLEDVNWVI